MMNEKTKAPGKTSEDLRGEALQKSEKENVSFEERMRELYERDRIRVEKKVAYTTGYIDMLVRTNAMWLTELRKKAIVGILMGVLSLLLFVLSLILR